MFTFAIASGVNNGYLVADTFRDAVLKYVFADVFSFWLPTILLQPGDDQEC